MRFKSYPTQVANFSRPPAGACHQHGQQTALGYCRNQAQATLNPKHQTHWRKRERSSLLVHQSPHHRHRPTGIWRPEEQSVCILPDRSVLLHTLLQLHHSIFLTDSFTAGVKLLLLWARALQTVPTVRRCAVWRSERQSHTKEDQTSSQRC